ncbi:AbrB family transcriptional regulator [Rosenbergiella sp. S61]|uniref:AbrB family transcriptional regulator n=1 Tax=Rosenbergiella gaditana TaxID=2726987 RepID=A0ABS5STB2_9GAMM|nr:AbrB family transcriptional regulator [Rosenbergiella gaditana]
MLHSPRIVRWLVLVILSLVAVSLLEIIHLPAALMLGPMFIAIIFAVAKQMVSLNRTLFCASQAVVGAMIARAMPVEVFKAMQHTWPIFIMTVFSVIAVSTLLGAVLAKFKILPGTTALWGSSPGGATAMTLMAGNFGADVRLVAFMQYLRVLLVTLLATAVSHYFAPDSSATSALTQLEQSIAWGAFAITLVIIVAALLLSKVISLPAAPLLLSMVISNLAMNVGGLHIELPLPLLATAYAVIGWSIGLRFTKDILRYAFHALPAILFSVILLMAICCIFAWILVEYAGIDPLSAYLATSPGGADSVAIIASSVSVNQPFVMSMQTGRFIAVLFLGPALSRLVARWIH